MSCSGTIHMIVITHLESYAKLQFKTVSITWLCMAIIDSTVKVLGLGYKFFKTMKQMKGK